MLKRIRTNGKPSVIRVDVATRRPEEIWIKVADTQRKNTYYTKRYSVVDGKKSFFVNMPQSPQEAVVIVDNDKFGLERGDSSFRARAG